GEGRSSPRPSRPSPPVWASCEGWRHTAPRTPTHDAWRDRVRKQTNPGGRRRTASIDSQSVDTSSGGEATGRDNAKNVDGRKRHIVVDSLGLLLAVVVTAADVDDAAAAPEALKQLAGQPLCKGRLGYAGTKYHNHALYGGVAGNGGYGLEVVRRPEGAEGWVKLPIRWTVERTFAWLNKCRRLSVDREKSIRSAEAMIRLAMIHLMLNRLCPKQGQA